MPKVSLRRKIVSQFYTTTSFVDGKTVILLLKCFRSVTPRRPSLLYASAYIYRSVPGRPRASALSAYRSIVAIRRCDNRRHRIDKYLHTRCPIATAANRVAADLSKSCNRKMADCQIELLLAHSCLISHSDYSEAGRRR